ncbi:HGGxSTG domain-containing protein [Pseudomonas pseudonitroreducens]|uniref:HGGxSTG domain-containing protein n=1 Tax=Pseudomonas pseudonitroreducens TaxID=2892326 RepID=UPI0035A23FE5
MKRSDDPQSELRQLYREYCKACERWSEAWAASGYIGDPPPRPHFPEELRSLCCGAKTRAGTSCKRRDLYASGRCKLHGGLSTGPKSPRRPAGE